MAESERSLLPQYRGARIPLILIAIMTMVLITAADHGDGRQLRLPSHRANTTALMLITAAFGATFVGMQAFEWTKLIGRSCPWGTPGRGAVLDRRFYDHRFPRPARIGGRDLPDGRSSQGLAGFYDSKGSYETVEIAGLYWHFVDLVWYSFSHSFILVGHMETVAGHQTAEGQQHPIRVYLWIWACCSFSAPSPISSTTFICMDI